MKQRSKASIGTWLTVCALAAMTMLAGCKSFFTAVNNNPGGTGTSSYVYVTNVGNAGSGGTLSAYTLTSGVLAQISGSPITLASTPTSVVVAPNNAFLYVGTSLGVYLYTIGSGGALTEGNSSTIVYLGPTSPKSMVIDSTSSWLIIANKGSSELDALPISPTTGIPTTTTPIFVTLDAATPQQLAIAPANNNIFVALGANGTDALSFSPTGKTTLGKPVPMALHAGSGAANAVATDTTSAYVFIGETTSNLIRVFALSDLSKELASYSTGNSPVAILPDAKGNYVYVASSADNSIAGFSFSSGALTVLPASPFATAKAPIGVVEDSSKSFLMSAGFGVNPNLWLYSFDATTGGTLDVKTTTSTATVDPSLANAIAVSH